MFGMRERIAQSLIEYLLLLCVVAVLVFVGMKQGGFVHKAEDKSLDFYHEAGDKIKGIK